MKQTEATSQKYYRFIKHCQREITIENLTSVIRSFKLPTYASNIFQSMGYLKKEVGFYLWNYQGEITEELISSVVDQVANANRNRMHGKEYVSHKYLELLNCATNSGYNSSAPICEMALDIGDNDYREGIRLMKKQINN